MVIAFTNTEGSPLMNTAHLISLSLVLMLNELTKMGTVLRVAFELLSELDRTTIIR